MAASGKRQNRDAQAGGLGSCEQCSTRGAARLGFEIAMAFQPIVDLQQREIIAHEALVRTGEGGSAGEVFARIDETNRYAFDQTCRRVAIREACELGLETRLSINFLPNAVYEPANCIQATLAAARKYGLPLERIMLEVTESEQVGDHGHLKAIIDDYRGRGFLTAIDDFGAGYSGLNLLAEWQPDFIKLDMQLTRDIDSEPVRRRIVEGIVNLSGDLGITPIAEGVETLAELEILSGLGLRFFQGYLFARPAFRRLLADADIAWPGGERGTARA